jgi:hypothetical protein
MAKKKKTGSGKDIQDDLLQELEDAANEYGKKILEEYKSNVPVASGSLKNGAKYRILKGDSGITIEYVLRPYWDVVEYGRRPNQKPPPIAPIMKWIKQKGLVQKWTSRVEDRARSGRFTKGGSRNFNNDVRSMAYAIANSIAEKGTKARRTMTDAVSKYQKDIDADLGKRFAKFLKIQVTKTVKQANDRRPKTYVLR